MCNIKLTKSKSIIITLFFLRWDLAVLPRLNVNSCGSNDPLLPQLGIWATGAYCTWLQMASNS
jgi:hypothetical protein